MSDMGMRSVLNNGEFREEGRKPNGDYCSWILDSEKWGGSIELSILADHYKREIAACNIRTTRCDLYGQLVVKSQIFAGGRSLGTFKSGLKGGVHIVKADQVEDIAGNERVGELAKKYGLKLHIDGARIFNTSVALGVPIHRLVHAADSVSVSNTIDLVECRMPVPVSQEDGVNVFE